MKKMKKILALLLCLTMAISGPLSVFAEETDITIEETVTEEEKSSVCEICQQEPCVCVSEEAGESEETAQVCENCQQEPCVCVLEETEESKEAAQVCETCQQETCICNQANAVSENEDSKPQVGDEIWIKHGSKVYKSQSENNGWSLWGNYKVKIVNIIADENNNAIWYEFQFTSPGIGEYLLKGYKYVQAENTSVEKPKETESIDKHVCNCGENALENIADHADSCPRKAYIKTLFDGKSAEEIYANWETYDEATQTDLLNMLQKWDNKKYEELKKLVDEAPEGEKETTVGDISLKVQGVPEDVTLDAKTVAPKSWDEAVFEAVGNKKVVFAIDITLNGEEGQWQPAEGEPVTVSLDAASLGLSEGERIGILHDHDGELNDLGICTVTDGKLTFTTNGFSVFYGYTVDFEYDGTLHSFTGDSIIFMSDLLKTLNIERNVEEISDVTFSDPSLIKITYANYDPLESNYVEWFLESLQPFDTEELLVITFHDGSVIEIKVYDATYSTINGDTTWANGSTVAGCTVQNNATITINGTVTLQGNIVVPAGKTLTIIGGTIKRGFTGTMLSVKDGGTLIIDGTTIDGNGSGSEYSGNAIHCNESKLELKNGAKITNNQGCGIWVDTETNAVDVDIIDSTIAFCRASAGSAIYLFGNGTGNVNLSRSVIENCYSKESNKLPKEETGELCSGTIRTNGGGQWKLTLEDCVMRNNNTDGHGGGIYWNARSGGAKLTIKDCQFLNNYALNFGGAIFNEGVCEITATPGDMTEPITSSMPGDIIGTLISGNIAGDLNDTDRSEYVWYDDTELGIKQPCNNRGFGGGICVKTYNGGYTDEGSVGAVQLTLGDNIKIENNKAIDGAGIMLYVRELGNVPENFEYKISVDGATINDNIASDKGGGIYFWNALGKYKTVLSLENGTISNNNAKNGGAAYVENTGVTFGTIEIRNNKATQDGGALYLDQNQSNSGTLHITNVSAGTLSNNAAEDFGGGIYQTGVKGECTVSGAGSITDNKASNGGGIYINNGKLTVSGGIITKNKANGDETVDQVVSGKTAYNLSKGVGGGIYVNKGSFVMSGDAELIGIYGNLADFAADDAYASGIETTLTLPDVSNMKLAEAYQSAEGWFADYVSNDTWYEDKKPFVFTNNGRYRTTGNVDNPTGAINGGSYYCVTLGRIPSLVITKILESDKQPDHGFMFEVVKPDNTIIKVVIPSNAFELVDGKMQASVTITKLITGKYTVREIIDWSWRYEFESAETKRALNFKVIDNGVMFDLSTDGEETIFKNKRTKPSWLSGDSYCENWWGGANGTTVVKRNEKNEIINE